MTRPSFLASVSKRRWRSVDVRFDGGPVISAALTDNAQARETNTPKRLIHAKYFRELAVIRFSIRVSRQFSAASAMASLFRVPGWGALRRSGFLVPSSESLTRNFEL